MVKHSISKQVSEYHSMAGLSGRPAKIRFEQFSEIEQGG
jgi:hypothetical protein